MAEDTVWQDLCQRWNHLASKRPIKPGAVIQFLFKDTKELRYGQVDKIMNERIYVKIADGVIMVLKGANSVWSFVPDRYLNKAHGVITAGMNSDTIMRLASIEGVKLIVLSASAQGLRGGASLSSGLANLGGGALATGGTGMAGGVVLVTSAPSLLTAHTLYHLSNALENNTATPTAVALGGVGGAVSGAIGTLLLVSGKGSVPGLSAPGVSSGLAAIGGGSLESGGDGMMGGLARLCCMAASVALAGGTVAWAVARKVVQKELEEKRVRMVDLAVQHGFKVLLE